MSPAVPAEPLKAGEHTLTYQRTATAEKDGRAGLLFLHRWSTGSQALVFQGLSGAQRWLDAVSKPTAQFP